MQPGGGAQRRGMPFAASSTAPIDTRAWRDGRSDAKWQVPHSCGEMEANSSDPKHVGGPWDLVMGRVCLV